MNYIAVWRSCKPYLWKSGQAAFQSFQWFQSFQPSESFERVLNDWND